MADIEYDVAYVARSPASMRQDDFAAMVEEVCNGRAVGGWRLVNTAGDYGAKVTLGVWLYFTREAASRSGRPLGGDDDSVPRSADSDDGNDELTDKAEEKLRTDPTLSDSEGDTLPDPEGGGKESA